MVKFSPEDLSAGELYAEKHPDTHIKHYVCLFISEAENIINCQQI